jgi:hypothetical protein
MRDCQAASWKTVCRFLLFDLAPQLILEQQAHDDILLCHHASQRSVLQKVYAGMRHAVGVYDLQFFAKVEDDAYVDVPVALATLTKLEALLPSERLYMGSFKDQGILQFPLDHRHIDYWDRTRVPQYLPYACVSTPLAPLRS